MLEEEKSPALRNRRKSTLAPARLHRELRDRRQNFLYKVTTVLASTRRAIVMEDLRVRGEAWRRNARWREPFWTWGLASLGQG